jgi:hypothetical protein
MLRPLPCLLLFTTAVITNAQPQNALDFDGVDDKVTVTAASGLVANAPGISLTCWVYPRNSAPGFPDFDGIAGFRNEFDCDFYLLQLTATSIEARFRNSAFEVFTVEGSGLQLNAWQLLVLTYDGSTLSLYIDGTLSASIAANGTIANTTTDMLIGDLVYDINDFWLNGKVDEVNLVKRALTQEEVSCLQETPLSTGDPDLVLYYNCDQGTPGGNNTTQTTLTDNSGHIDGTLSGFALTGTGSNFVQGTGFGVTQNELVCPGQGVLYNGQTLTAGTYQFSFPTGGACDSVVTLTISEIPMNLSVNATATTLTSLNGSASWQWLDCGNGFAEIPGATFQTFTPTTSGSYAVEITDNGCVDTSACYDITMIGLEEHSAQLSARLLPTVTEGQLRLLLGSPQGTLLMTITDTQGREVMRSQAPAKAEQWLDVSGLGKGLYHLRASTPTGSRVLRFVRE